jgi:hypothetical protein
MGFGTAGNSPLRLSLKASGVSFTSMNEPYLYFGSSASSVNSNSSPFGASVFKISLVAKDYLASILGWAILCNVKRIRPGTRTKILSTHSIKGDVLEIGSFRSITEVGEKERLQ